MVLSPAQASDAGLYRAVATDECHAAYSDPAVLVVRALPPCDIDVAEGVCAGVGGYVAAVPDAGDEAAYVWTIEGGQIESGQGTPTIVFTSGGVGTLVVGVSITDRHGCSCEGTREITVYANPVAAAGNTGPVCDGQAVSLLGGPAGMAAYEWIGPGDFSSNEQNPVVVPAVPGEYCLTVTDDQGCTSTACTNVEVFADPAPVITATPGEIVCEGTPVLLDAGAGYVGYLWSTGAATQTIVVTASGTYSVTVIDDHGCSGTDDIRITAAATANVEVEAELVGVHLAGVQRCIRFIVDDCSAVGDHVLTFLDHDGDDADGDGYQDPGQTLPATPVRFVGTVAVPCGDWTLLCAKDEQHTLFASTTLTDHGTHFTANSLLSLIGGDTDNDSDVDIHDVTFFMAVYGGPAVAGGCPWAGGRDADFSNDGTINAVDWTFLTAGWLTWAPCGCWGTDGTAPDKIPAGPAVVAATAVPAWVAARADLNHDGLLDYRDVRTFERRHGLGNALSTALGQAGAAQPASAPQTKALPQSGGVLGI